MSKYKKSNKTKNIIIQASKELFYEKGYVDTYYKDISKKTNLSPGLIHYHFRSKKNIASVVFDDFFGYNKLFIDQILENKYDWMIKVAVEIRNYLTLYLTNEKMKKFYYEIGKDRVLLENSKYFVSEFFQSINDEYKLNLSTDYIKMISLASIATETEIFLGYIDGFYEYSIEDIIDFDLRTSFEFLYIEEKRINEIIKISKDIFSSLDIRLKDYFELELVSNTLL